MCIAASKGDQKLKTITISQDGRLARAWQDAASGLARWRLWARLGWNDVMQKYRRSVLGPLWLTASTAVMVVALGFIYAKLFRVPIVEFMPYLCVGLIFWNYLSSFLLEAGSLFTGSESYIKQIRLPYTVYVYRSMWSKLIILAHNIIIYFGLIAYFQIWPGLTGLLAVPGVLILTLNGALAGMLVGMVSARFRDIPQLINSVMQIAFFVTPIMWKPELLQEQVYLATWNPFHVLLEIVRAPLLGQIPSLITYEIALAVTVCNFAITSLLFVRFRSRLAYWV
jgi:lipopolysaccharide transport system permease protein